MKKKKVHPVNFRFEKSVYKKLRGFADKYVDGNLTRGLEQIIDFYFSLDPWTWNIMAEWSEKTGLPISVIAEGLILGNLAQQEGYAQVHGKPSPTALMEFKLRGMERPRGEKLSDALLEDWISIFEKVKEALENQPQMPISQMAEEVKQAAL